MQGTPHNQLGVKLLHIADTLGTGQAHLAISWV